MPLVAPEVSGVRVAGEVLVVPPFECAWLTNPSGARVAQAGGGTYGPGLRFDVLMFLIIVCEVFGSCREGFGEVLGVLRCILGGSSGIVGEVFGRKDVKNKQQGVN